MPASPGLLSAAGAVHAAPYAPRFAGLSLHSIRRGNNRQAAYRELFRHELAPGMVDGIGRATNDSYVLGRERFAADVAAAQGRRMPPGISGRPRQMAAPESRSLFGIYAA